MEFVIAIVAAVFASTGFWALMSQIYASKKKSKSAESKLILGLAYSKILDKCAHYCELGNITPEEYRDLDHYLYEPYKAMGGNGTAEKAMEQVRRLPLIDKRGADND